MGAAGVSPVDLAIRAGTSPSAKQLELPHIPGVDAAGVVDEVGGGVTGDRGRFRIPVQAAFPFELAAEAHALAAEGPRRGKIALTASVG